MVAVNHHFPIGNRCGHNPLAPRCFVPPPEHRRRPGILLRLSDELKAYYDKPAQVLPTLNFANGSTRQQRSERRESCLIVLDTLIHYLDLDTLHVGIPREGGAIIGLTMDFIAHRAGLCLGRVERAVKDLKRAGIITVRALITPSTTGGLTGLPAVRELSPKLFDAFGLGHWLKQERQKAQKRRRKAKRQAARAERAKLELAMPDNPTRHIPQGPAATYDRTREVVRLMEANPGADLQSLFDQVRRRYPTPSAHPA